ncbi:MAG: cation:proton antiporter [Bacteroidetes bacterium]|nr:cation:proton antiporter [Bacteroidota bacterium]
MKLSRNSIFYILSISIFVVLMWFVLGQGKKLESSLSSFHSSVITGKVINANPEQSKSTWIELKASVSQSFHHPVSILLLQIVVIILVSRLFGFFFQKIGQPTVIGEVLAGIMLGPSFLGLFFPGTFGFIFPHGSLDTLQFLSQIGLILFMFIIGMELDLKLLKNTASTAVLVSHSSIIIPFLLGVILSLFLFANYSPQNIGFLPFALFMGISMSITAFPVLARILQERGITRTPLGTMALTCGAIDDVTAWAMLAIVIAIVKSGSMVGAIYTISLTLIYIGVMLFLVQPFLARVGKIYIAKETINKTLIALIFSLLLFSSYITESIGIHALFGAFVAGLIMPHNIDFKKNLIEKIEDISLVLFLPLFFAFTGLRTQIGLLNEGYHWWIFLLVLAVAIIGKFGGGMMAARYGGLSWNISLAIGILMNTRGLIELVVLNIGYELGILSPQIFAIMVLMALVTTFMTNPLLQLNDHFFRKKAQSVVDKLTEPFKVLISFGPPAMGSTLLKVAQQLSPPGSEQGKIQYSAIHLTPSSEVHPAQALIFEEEGFSPIKKAAQADGITIKTIYKATDDVQNEIIRTANKGNFDMLLMGSARSVFTENYLGGKIRRVLNDCKCNIGIFVDKYYSDCSRVLVLIPGTANPVILRMIRNLLIRNETHTVTLLNTRDTGLPPEFPVELSEEFSSKLLFKPFSSLSEEILPDKANDLVVIPVEEWKTLFTGKIKNLEVLPSILILKTVS